MHLRRLFVGIWHQIYFFLNIMSGLLYVCFVSVCKGLLFSIKYKLGLS